MRLPLTKFDSITLTIIIVPQTLSPSCLLSLVHLGVYIVNSCAFYSYRLIGKLTAFLHLQEFSLRNLTVVSSTTPRSPHSSSLRPTVVCHGDSCHTEEYLKGIPPGVLGSLVL